MQPRRTSDPAGTGTSTPWRRRWPAAAAATLAAPRYDIVAERAHDGGFEQDIGPFAEYERHVRTADGGRVLIESTRYRYVLPWFAWLFALPLRWTIGRRPRSRPHSSRMIGRAVVDATHRLTPRHLLVLGLLAAASMASAFVNTLFTQTVSFAGDDFSVSDGAIGVAGSLVRAGIVLVLPMAVLADRRGRRSIVVAVAVAAPLVTALGALAPTFPFLVATQAIGRPLGLALKFMVAVMAIRRCRATRRPTP